MPMTDDPGPPRDLYPIGAVCKLVGVESHVLRYWEAEFPIIRPLKDRDGRRRYRPRDLSILLRLRELLYVERLTLDGAKRKLKQEFGDHIEDSA